MYCTIDQMKARFGEDDLIQLSDADGFALESGPIEQAIADAAGVIDSYLSRRYVLPLPTPPPPVLVDICADMAMYRLMRLRRRGDLEDTLNREKECIAWLKDVAMGKATLGPGFDPPHPPGGTVFIASNPRMVSRGSTRGL